MLVPNIRQRRRIASECQFVLCFEFARALATRSIDKPVKDISKMHKRLGIKHAISAIMKSIIAGVILIGIGLAIGDSIFQGHFGVTSLFFDGLGFFWIGKGLFRLWRQRQPQQ